MSPSAGNQCNWSTRKLASACSDWAQSHCSRRRSGWIAVVVIPLTDPLAARAHGGDVAQSAEARSRRGALDADGRGGLRGYNPRNRRVNGVVAVVKDHQLAVREGLPGEVRHGVARGGPGDPRV